MVSSSYLLRRSVQKGSLKGPGAGGQVGWVPCTLWWERLCRLGWDGAGDGRPRASCLHVAAGHAVTHSVSHSLSLSHVSIRGLLPLSSQRSPRCLGFRRNGDGSFSEETDASFPPAKYRFSWGCVNVAVSLKSRGFRRPCGSRLACREFRP